MTQQLFRFSVTLHCYGRHCCHPGNGTVKLAVALSLAVIAP
ncbi:MAG TPA: hypothetical protein V6D34_05535 [Candidatus Sericytochromatia bacterium]